MAKANKSTTSTQRADGTDFVDVVEQALRKFKDPATLARDSPLAAPYLLHKYDTAALENNEDPPDRGAMVQQLLRDGMAVVCTHPKYGDRWRTIFDLRYLRVRAKSEVQIAEELGLGESAYHNHRKRAIEKLAQELIRLIKPALHLEAPDPLPNLVGRDPELVTGLSILQQRQTLNILGAGGIGKTTFGIELARQFAPDSTFWFTV